MKRPFHRLGHFLAELKRRKVYHVAAAYGVAAFVIVQAADLVFEALLLPAWVFRLVVVILLAGLPVALALSWAFDITSEGIRRTASNPASDSARVRLMARGSLVLVVLGVAVTGAWLAWEGRLGPAAAVGDTDGSTAPDLDPRRIAVLYFDDFSEGKDLGYLAAGFTETLIHELNQVSDLDVVSRNGVKPFRDGNVGTDSIARALEAGTLVEGSVIREADTIRVHVQLIDGSSGGHLGSRVVERQWGETLGLLDDLGREVSRLLRQDLGVAVRRREWKAGTRSDEAWELLQRAEEFRSEQMRFWNAGDREAAARALRTADNLLSGAESKDPEWVEPIVLRGWVAEAEARFMSDSPRDYVEEPARRALDHAERALEMTPDHPEALELRGTVLFGLWDSELSENPSATLGEAEADLRAAVTADPSLAGAWSTLSELLQVGRADPEEAMWAAERALGEDQFLEDARAILFRLASLATELGRYEEAMRWSREGQKQFPEMVDFYATELMGLTHVAEGREDGDRAWTLTRAIDSLSPPAWKDRYGAGARMQVAAILGLAGLPDSGRAVLRRTRSGAPEDVLRWSSYEEAYARLVLGQRDEALEALEIFLEADPSMRNFVANESWFEPLRSDPRFQELVSK